MKSPSQLEDHLGYWLRQLSNHVSESFAVRVERHGVSVASWVVLRVLFGHKALPLKELVTQIGVDQGALSRMVERLVQRGLVTRSESPTSRREVAISLTVEGRKLVPLLAREADENDLACFKPLSPKQRAELLATIQALLPHGHHSSALRPPMK